MPSRVVRESINRSKSLARVSVGANWWFRCLLNCCDDYGRMEADPAVLRGTVCPLHVDQVSVQDIVAWLYELARADDPQHHPGIEGDLSPIALYQIDRIQYLYFTRWEDHRGRSKRGSRSRFPAPPSHPQAASPPAATPPPAEVPGDPRESAGVPGGPSEESRSRGVEEKKKSSLSARALPAEALEMVALLNLSILHSTPGATTATTEHQVNAWAAELDRLHRIGAPGSEHGWTWQQIEAVLRWLPSHQGSNGFAWGPQIRSASKLRVQFPRLHVEMMKVSGGSVAARRDRAQGALQILLDRQEGQGQPPSGKAVGRAR